MGIAMYTLTSLFAPLQGLLGWFMPAAPARHTTRPAPRLHVGRPWQGHHAGDAKTPPSEPVVSVSPSRPRPRAASPSTGLRAPGTRHCATRPLRVLRVVEPGHQPASAGRMVISGRMADVCAELDRLVALEAQQPLRH